MKAIFNYPFIKTVRVGFNNPITSVMNAGDVNKYIKRMSLFGDKMVMKNLRVLN